MDSFLATADARRVSGRDFFDALFGLTPAAREERDREIRERCIRAIRSGDTYGWPPAMVEDCRKLMEKADG